VDSLLLYHVEAPRSVTIVIVISCQCDPSVSRHSDEQQQRKPNHCDTLYPISRCSFHLPCGLTALTKKTKVGFPRLTERREDRPEKPDRRDLGYRPRQSPFKRKITTHRTSRSARSRPKYPPSSHPPRNPRPRPSTPVPSRSRKAIYKQRRKGAIPAEPWSRSP
jgi:hypothetical protein